MPIAFPQNSTGEIVDENGVVLVPKARIAYLATSSLLQITQLGEVVHRGTVTREVIRDVKPNTYVFETQLDDGTTETVRVRLSRDCGCGA